MEFKRNTSRGFSRGIIGLLIKLGLVVLLITIIIIILDKTDLPAPSKNIIKKIPNEKLKIVK